MGPRRRGLGRREQQKATKERTAWSKNSVAVQTQFANKPLHGVLTPTDKGGRVAGWMVMKGKREYGRGQRQGRTTLPHTNPRTCAHLTFFHTQGPSPPPALPCMEAGKKEESTAGGVERRAEC